MGKGYKLSIVTDVAGAIKGSKDLGKEIDRLADSLDEVGTEGQGAERVVSRALDDIKTSARRVGNAIEDDIGDGLERAEREAKSSAKAIDAHLDTVGESAEAASKTVDRSFSKVWREKREEAEEASKAISRSTRESMSDGNEAVGEFKSEAKQNLSEVASSFQGDMTSAVDIVQGTLGGLASSLGPAGMVGAAAAAFGVGFVMSAWQKAKEKAEEFAEQVRELASEIYDAGGTESLDWAGRLEEAMGRLSEGAKRWGDATEDPKSDLEEWKQLADAAGVEFERFANAMVGNSAAASTSQAQLAVALDDVNARIIEAGATTETYTTQGMSWTAEVYHGTDALNAEREAIVAAQEKLLEMGGVVEGAAAQNDLLTEAQSRVTEQTAAQQLAQENLLESTATFSQATVQALEEAGGAVDQFTKDGVFNLSEYNANIETTASQIQAWQANLAAASGQLSEEAMSYIRSLGPDAAPLLQAFVDAPLEEKQRTADNWNTIGVASVQGYGDALAGMSTETRNAVADAQKEADKGVDIPMRVDGSGLQQDITRVVNNLTIAPITIPVRPGKPVP